MSPQVTLRGVAPNRIGRFTILWAIGEGAMGVVYAAYDEQLDRKVAVKMLLGDASRREPQARDRMLREAQSMARVSHPNIVTVHEVGVHDGEIYIAMEFLHGQSLADWLTVAQRSWREILGVFLHAGRGLAAAHAAGVIHRDFKPANVVVGDDGTVKVLDFGLARAVSPFSQALSQSARGELDVLGDVHLTQPGTTLGTPAYMSPEQHLGEPTTHLSDQFSFCVSLWEALYGKPPFDRSSLKAVKTAVTQGRLCEPPLHTDVPAALLPILRRGLALDPTARFPTMADLLAALERCLAPRRPPWYAVACLGGLLASLGVTAGVLAEREPPCSAAERELIGLWDDAAATAVHAGLRATGVPFAEDTWERVAPRLDAYAQALVDMRIEACRAHREGRASTHLFDLRTACLDQRHASLARLVGILQNADPEVVRNAAVAAATLPAIHDCDHPHALADALALPRDSAQAARVAQIRAALAEAHAHELTGQFAQGLARLDDLDLADLDHPLVLAEFGLRRGSLLSEAGRHDEADHVLADALRLALAHGDDRLAAALASRREFVRSARLQRAREVLAEAVFVEGLIARVDRHGEGAALRGDHLNNLGIAHAILNQPELARDEFAASLAVRTEALGPDHPEVVYALGNLGTIALDGDDLVAATDKLHAALVAAETVLGPSHPHIAQLALNLGRGYLALGRLRDAETSFTRALTLQTDLLGPDAPDLHYVHTALGDLALARRRCDDADAHYEFALRALGQTDAPSQPTALDPLAGRARVAACRGDLEHARALAHDTLRLAERLLGPDNVPLALVDELGDMYFQSSLIDQALLHYRRGEALRRARLPVDSPRLAESYRRLAEVERRRHDMQAAAAALALARELLPPGVHARSLTAAQLERSLGALALDRDRPDEAADHFERAAAVYAELADPDSLDLALTRFDRARALVRQFGGLSPEARDLVDTALTTVLALGPAYTPEAELIRSWRASLDRAL